MATKITSNGVTIEVSITGPNGYLGNAIDKRIRITDADGKFVEVVLDPLDQEVLRTLLF